MSLRALDMTASPYSDIPRTQYTECLQVLLVSRNIHGLQTFVI